MFFCPDDLVRATHRGQPDELQMILDSKERGCLNCMLVINAAETYRPGWTQNNQDRKSIGTDTTFDGVLQLYEETSDGPVVDNMVLRFISSGTSDFLV